MIAPPWMDDPFYGVYNPGLPVPDGGTAGTFVAWGWFRSLFTTAIPSYIADMEYVQGSSPGVLV